MHRMANLNILSQSKHADVTVSSRGRWHKFFDGHNPETGRDGGTHASSGGSDASSSPAGSDSAAVGGTTPSGNPSDFAHQLLTLTNTFRAEHGVAAMQWDDKLAFAAQQHTQDMADNHYFSHTEPDGDTFTDRLNQAGYHYSSAGENIAMGQTTPEAVMEAWENSPGHRANLLNADFTDFGAGYVDAARDLWTQNFGSEYV